MAFPVESATAYPPESGWIATKRLLSSGSSKAFSLASYSALPRRAASARADASASSSLAGIVGSDMAASPALLLLFEVYADSAPQRKRPLQMWRTFLKFNPSCVSLEAFRVNPASVAVLIRLVPSREIETQLGLSLLKLFLLSKARYTGYHFRRLKRWPKIPRMTQAVTKPRPIARLETYLGGHPSRVRIRPITTVSTAIVKMNRIVWLNSFRFMADYQVANCDPI